MNGEIIYYPHTREGANVTYRCIGGYRPSTVMLSNCTNAGQWMPPPDQHSCTLVQGMQTF